MKKSLIITLSLALLFISGCSLLPTVQKVAPIDDNSSNPTVNVPQAVEPIPLDKFNPTGKSDTCQDNNGIWLDAYRECENIKPAWCASHGGVFNECGSACRHQPEALFCTAQCVPYCDLSGGKIVSTTPATSTPTPRINNRQ